MCMVLNLVHPDPDSGGRDSRGLKLEAWRLWMTVHPLDTSGQKWTEPGMSPIVRRAIVATAATTASRQPENPLSVWSQFVDLEHCLLGCGSQFVPTQNWFEDITLGYCCNHTTKRRQFVCLWIHLWLCSPSYFLLSTKTSLSKRFVLGLQLWFHSVFLANLCIRGPHFWDGLRVFVCCLAVQLFYNCLFSALITGEKHSDKTRPTKEFNFGRNIFYWSFRSCLVAISEFRLLAGGCIYK